VKLEMNRGGWPMKVMQYGGLCVEDRTDLCSAFWTFLWGIVRAPFWVVFLGCFGAGALYLFVVLPIIALVAFFSEGLSIMAEGWFGMAAWALFAYFAYEVWSADSRNPLSVGGAVRLAKVGYRSWKDKTCVLIDVTEPPAKS
jgi:hypothetical protein